MEVQVGRNQDFKTMALTAVNARIVKLAEDSPPGEPAWEFYCECGRPECHEQVKLSREKYNAIRDDGRAILAAGHQVNQSARARRLVEEARALRAQADNQIKRANRNTSLADDVAIASLRAGAQVWVKGRAATFREHIPHAQAARVHFEDEEGTRVVSLAHIKYAPPG
jgi:hypothetical protein